MGVVLIGQGKSYLVKDPAKAFHTQYGFIAPGMLKEGCDAETNMGKGFAVINASFIDLYGKISRSPQIIPRKDIGLIMAETGIGKDSLVIDSGTGSGALCCMLARVAKKVVSYEIRPDFLNIAEKNKKYLGLNNLTIKEGDIYDGVQERNADLLTLDVPEPWKALDTASKCLKSGGFIVSYSPSVPQVMDFVSSLDKRFVHVKTCELIEREWEVNERKVRPKSRGIGHSGFLTFARKLR
ncbi:MAG: methyltransferase domain-containing protein [Nanoarchaeota archaeon]|nr:methyltransferase domain-containing protein [Nanoarchaeota archaeon]